MNVNAVLIENLYWNGTSKSISLEANKRIGDLWVSFSDEYNDEKEGPFYFLDERYESMYRDKYTNTSSRKISSKNFYENDKKFYYKTTWKGIPTKADCITYYALYLPAYAIPISLKIYDIYNKERNFKRKIIKENDKYIIYIECSSKFGKFNFNLDLEFKHGDQNFKEYVYKDQFSTDDYCDPERWRYALNLDNDEVIRIDEFFNGSCESLTIEKEKMTKFKVFISYSHADKGYMNKLEKHLSILKRSGIISTWNDRKIVVGDEWEDEINRNIEDANLVLFLISSDFMASEYCYNKEVKRAFERARLCETKIASIIVRPCDWTKSIFSTRQVLPSEGKPISTWKNKDEAYLNIVNGIRNLIETNREREEYTLNGKISPKTQNSDLVSCQKFLNHNLNYLCQYSKNGLISENFIKNYNLLKSIELKLALNKFLFNLIKYLDSNGKQPNVGTSSSISVYCTENNEKRHILYVRLTTHGQKKFNNYSDKYVSLRSRGRNDDGIWISCYMQFSIIVTENHSKHMYQTSYDIWNQISKCMGINLSNVQGIELCTDDFNKLTVYFSNYKL